MAAIKTLLAHLRIDGSEVNVPRALSAEAIRDLLKADLIEDFDDDQVHADRRYIATEHAKDLIWGKLPKRGRPRVPADKSRTERVEIRMTPAQKRRLTDLGGAQWVRDRIDGARPDEAKG